MSKGKVKCFLIEETNKAGVWLRRYASDSSCPEGYYHNEMNFWKYIEHIPGDYTPSLELTEKRKNLLDFPVRCSCGYKFEEDDEWQLFTKTIWKGVRDGKVYEGRIEEMPAGAMWNAWWMPSGEALTVKLPNNAGDWNIDGPATNGNGWERSGTPPNVTVKPSIGKKKSDGSWMYHGWLRDGYLIEI